MHSFADILNAGPMSRIANLTEKLSNDNMTKQAGITDVLKNSDFVMDAAHFACIDLPLMPVGRALYARTEKMGLDDQDMIAVVKAIGSVGR